MYSINYFKGLFLNYDKWFELNSFNKKYYGNEGTNMLYKDRWMLLVFPFIGLIMFAVIIFMWLDLLA